MFQQTTGHHAPQKNFWNASTPSFDIQQQQQQPPFNGWWVHTQTQPTHVRPISNELIFPRSSPANRFDANFQDNCSYDQGSGSERFPNRPIPSLRTRPLNRPKSPPKSRPEDQWQINVDTGRPIKIGGRIHKRITKRKSCGTTFEELSGDNTNPTTKSHDQKTETNSSSPGDAFKEPHGKKIVPAAARKDKKIQVDSWSIDLESEEPSQFKY